ncbi:hypothetical protein QJQ45_021261, partial [Haematococcus lacustris]
PLSPQCALDDQGQVVSVRCECEPCEVTPGPSGGGPEEAAGPAAVLVDCVDLALPETAVRRRRAPRPTPGAGALAAGGGAARVAPGRLGVLSEEEEEEESGSDDDYGMLGLHLGSDGSSQGADGCRLSLVTVYGDGVGGLTHPQGAGSLGLGSQQQQQQPPSQTQPTIWVCHGSGCWTLGLTWLQAVARASSAAGGAAAAAHNPNLPPLVLHELWFQSGKGGLAAEGAGAHPGSSPQGQGQGQGQGHGEAGLTAGSAVVVSSSVVQDVFLGSVAVLLQQQVGGAGEGYLPEGASLLCCRPRHGGPVAPATPQPPPGSEAAAAAASGGLGVGQGAGGVGGGGTPGVGGLGAAEEEEDAAAKLVVEASLQTLYGDLLSAPPFTPAIPRGTGGLEVSTPEGAAALTAAIRALRCGRLEALHRLHQALRQRAGQLALEADRHAAGVEELEGPLAAAQTKQATLTAQLQRAVALHTNLAERAGLLTQLHWSLPRPLSVEERQLAADLDVLELRTDTLRRTWDALRRRAQRAVQDRAASLAGPREAGVGTEGSVPKSPGAAIVSDGVLDTPKALLGTWASGMKGGALGTVGRVISTQFGFSPAWLGGKSVTGRAVAVSTGRTQPTGRLVGMATVARSTATRSNADVGAGGGSTVTPELPAAQLAKVQARMLEHVRSIAQCSAQAQALSKEVDAFVAARVAQHLEKELESSKAAR